MNKVWAALLVVMAISYPSQSFASGQTAPENRYPEIRALLKADKYDAALAAAIEATDKHPDDATAFFLLGRTQFYRKNDDAALAAFTKVIALDPAFAEAWFYRGVVYRFTKQLDLARPDLEKSVALNPKDEKYWFELGQLEHSAKRNKEATVALEKAAGMNPKRTSTWFLLHSIAEGNGDYTNTADYMGKVLAIDPEQLSAHYNLALHHQLRGDANVAVTHFKVALKQTPDDLDVLRHLVQTYHRLEDFDNAQIYRTEFLARQAKSTDPKIRAMKEFCFDQFEVPGGKFFAYEKIEKSGSLFYWFTYKLVNPDGKIIKTINFESSEALKEEGLLFLLGSNEGAVHRNFGIVFKKMPTYPELKKWVLKVHRNEIAPGATTTRGEKETKVELAI
jgi:tetratricopeptide (TPR) repeat protein